MCTSLLSLIEPICSVQEEEPPSDPEFPKVIPLEDVNWSTATSDQIQQLVSTLEERLRTSDWPDPIGKPRSIKPYGSTVESTMPAKKPKPSTVENPLKADKNSSTIEQTRLDRPRAMKEEMPLETIALFSGAKVGQAKVGQAKIPAPWRNAAPQAAGAKRPESASKTPFALQKKPEADSKSSEIESKEKDSEEEPDGRQTIDAWKCLERNSGKAISAEEQDAISVASSVSSHAKVEVTSGSSIRSTSSNSPGIYAKAMLPATSSPPPPPPPGVPSRAQRTVPPLPPPPPPPRQWGEPGPVGRPGTRKPRPRGRAQNPAKSANARWFQACYAAIAKGPKCEWMFRWQFPKPGDEGEHTTFVNSVKELETWPTEEQLSDGSYVMLFPSHWRRGVFIKCSTMDEFYDAKYKKEWAENARVNRQFAEAWNESSTCKRKDPNWCSYPDYNWTGFW